jgi:hypothetical protein
MRAAALCLAGSLALLAGCSRSEHKASAPAQPPASPAGGLAALARPHPRPGLWKTTIDTDAGPGVRMKGELCLDERTEDAAFSNAPKSAKAHCEKTTFGPGPSGGIGFKSICTAKGRTIVNEGVASGDFNSTYAIDVTTRMDPPIPGAPGQVRTRIQATYAGPCRPGQKPGQASMKFGGLG